MSKFLTIVKVIDSDLVLKRCLDNIINSKLYQNDDIQLLLVDLVNSKKTKKYISENNLKDNLVSVDKDTTIPQAFNICKDKINGEYVNFSTTSTFIDGDTYNEVDKLLQTSDCVIINPVYFPTDNLKYVLNYFKHSKTEIEQKNYFSIKDNPEFFNPLLDCYYFKYSKVKNIDFESDELNYSTKYIFDIMLKFNNYVYSLKTCNYTKVLENDFNNYHNQYLKEFYIEFMKNFVLPYIKENNNSWIQYSLLYLVSIRYCSNLNARNKNVLDEYELTMFENCVDEFLGYIDYSVLKEFNSPYITRTLIEKFIKTKSKGDLKLVVENDTLLLKNKDEVVLESQSIRVDVKILEFDNNKLCIDAEILSSIFINNEDQIKVYLNDEVLEYKKNDVYTYTKFFNKIGHKKYSFRLEIPIEKLDKKKNIIYFEYNYENYKLKINATFKCPLSKLNVHWNNTYFRFADKILTYDKENFDLIIKEKSNFTIIKKEIGLIFEYLFKSKNNRKLGIKSVGLRLLYWITKPFFEDRIWISFDKLFKGGDNGEYFYHYVLLNKNDVKMCYVINKDSDDYKRLQSENCKNVLPFRSIKHYLNVLNCEYMFATHANPYDYNGYTSGVEKYFRDLLTFKTFCIQHGLSVNQIAKFQNRVYADTKLYFCASKYEIKNLSLPEYDYDGYDALRLTGVPRYDGLKNKEKKIILITPTWRQSSSSKLVHLNMARQYNKEFKDSVYYKVYNDLINDETLIESAKKNGYKIIYLLHPAVSSQQKDFKGNEYVDVIAATSDMSYEKILTESSLMVTDYSGVQFDFAYMRKPILYYHPTELPPHYEESCFIYDTMGFGPIIDNQDKLVKSLCEYMDNGCKMEQKYIDRANDFFEYSDFDNCKRILENVEKYTEEKK